MDQLTQMEMVEVSDAISEVLNNLIKNGDPEKLETKCGTLTLLHRAQAQLMPPAFGFKMEEAPWGTERFEQITAIRRHQDLPAAATDVEQTAWHSGVVSDAISEVLARLISTGDPEKHETKYGTLTLLSRAQAKLLPDLVDFTEEAPAWWTERLVQINAIRRKQRLPVEPSDTEAARWHAGVTPRM